MKRLVLLLRFWAIVMAIALGPYKSATAAVSCQLYWGPGINFGSIDTIDGNVSSASGTINYGCGDNGPEPIRVLMCIGIRDDPVAPGFDPRYMPLIDGSQPRYNLGYRLYQDAARTTLLGSLNSGGSAGPLAIVLTIDPYWGGGYLPIYGDIKTFDQTGLPSGNYDAPLTVEMSYMVYNDAIGANCNNAQMLSGLSGGGRVGVNVTRQCHINSVSDLNFGVVYGQLAQNLDGASTFQLACSTSLPYSVDLNDGQHSDGQTRRMQGTGGYLRYELYRDSQRTQPWGSMAGSHMLGTGTGSVQTHTIYGRVMPQPLPGDGVFSDTVILTITY